MVKNKKFFIFLSLAIALIDAVFVTANYFFTRDTFYVTLQEDSQNDYAIYKTVLESTYNGLSMQATLFASDKRIQDLFLQGKKALELESKTTGNEGTGGPKTAEIRNQLYQLVATPWQIATKQFDVRQLHFHLGPGALSFLRVHKPEKFGDRIDDLRFIIVDTNAEQTPRSGFETGRIYSGLRSVMPIFAWDQEVQKDVYVGALEVGTSYKKLLETIDQNINIELSVLLNNKHIKETVWDEFITGNYNNNTINGCNCILEASSRPHQKKFLSHIAKKINSENQSKKADGIARLIKYNEHYYSYTFHPFRDYLGTKIPSRTDIGAIFIARNINEQMTIYNEEQWFNLLYGIIAFIIIELLLFITFFKVTNHLTAQVKIQTKELLEQKRVIELDKVKYKNLANAINESYFFYTRDKDNNFTFVSSSVHQVLGFSKKEFLDNPVQYLPQNAQTEFVLKKARQTFIEQNQNSFEVEIYNKSGRIQYLLVTETPKYDENKRIIQVEGMAQDITRIRQDKMLLQLRCQVLQLISDSHSHENILNVLVKGVESIIQDVNCVIMIYDHQNNILEVGAAPSIPTEFKQKIDHLDVTLENNACSIAATSVKRKIISSINFDSEKSPLDTQSPNKKKFVPVYKDSPYKACCSEPVLSTDAKVLATVDFYYKKTGMPNESDLFIISAATDLVCMLFEPHVNKF
ncbi:MAG: PAS domain S-box protein [Gammaproteobacteria bacterium]|nr:PAS domain S-box protein [Gammaproteobacteria bacterium]